MCGVHELSEIEDGGDCNLNFMRVWTSRECVRSMPHPHHPDRFEQYEGHMATTTGKDAEANDQCVPEESPMAVLCCADGDVVYVPPPASTTHPGGSSTSSSYEDDTFPPGDGTGPGALPGDASGGGVPMLAIFVIVCFAGCCLYARRGSRQLEERQVLRSGGVASSAEGGVVSSVKRAGGRAKHHKLREDAVELTESASLGEAAANPESSWPTPDDEPADEPEESPPSVGEPVAMTLHLPPHPTKQPPKSDAGAARHGTDKSRTAAVRWDDDEDPAKEKACKSAALGIDIDSL